jgi:thioredoxin 1
MIEVSNKIDFERQLKKNKKVLALFYASWCPYCKNFLPVFGKNTSKRDSLMVLYVKIDDYDNPLWEEYSIEAVPAVIFFEAGRVCSRLDARLGCGLNEQQFKQWLKEN